MGRRQNPPLHKNQIMIEITTPIEALRFIRNYAFVTAKHWDDDNDTKTGKRLLAMAGKLPGYCVELDFAYELLRGEKPLDMD
jgi:hypothetical protein